MWLYKAICPCMNKKQFPQNRFTSYPSSSILCYAFNVLPAGIYQRLIASCLQIPWKSASSRDGPFIYQTAAVFLFEKHNILLGMTPTEIQLQVFNTEGEVDLSTCLTVKKEIDNMLSILSTSDRMFTCRQLTLSILISNEGHLYFCYYHPFHSFFALSALPISLLSSFLAFVQKVNSVQDKLGVI